MKLDGQEAIDGLLDDLPSLREKFSSRETSVVEFQRPTKFLTDDLARLEHALPILVKHYQSRNLDYDEWINKVVGPIQGSFDGTSLWPRAQEIFTEVTQRLPGYKPGDERKLADFHRTSGTRRTVATIFAEVDKLDPEWRKETRRSQEKDKPPTPLPDGLDPADDLFDAEVPPLEYAIMPYLPRAEVVEIHGPHGQFKSTIMLYATLSVASGLPWNGPNVPVEGRAVFISLEDRTPTLARRTRAWFRGMFPEVTSRALIEKKVRRNLRFLGREKAAALTITEMAYGEAHPKPEVVEWLVTQLQGCSLAVLETAARISPGPEDNAALAVLAMALEEVATRTGCCIVLVRHVAKAVAVAGVVTSYGGRGGGSFADAARGVLSVVRCGDGAMAAVRVTHTKSTHTAPGPDLEWRPVPAGEWGVYLEPLRGEALSVAREVDVLKVVREAGEDGITWDALRSRVPGGTGIVKRREEWKAALERLVAAGTVRFEKVTKGGRYYESNPGLSGAKSAPNPGRSPSPAATPAGETGGAKPPGFDDPLSAHGTKSNPGRNPGRKKGGGPK